VQKEDPGVLQRIEPERAIMRLVKGEVGGPLTNPLIR
jgi:hypothetical protein